ncbi:MAG: copper amine oxidase N-terminal domain-containing protein [Clostridiales bacterium]|nr:copper amine oxidase N-terminal domain-containing protein [Clostridiales bacterium]
MIVITPVKIFFSYNNSEKVVEVPVVPNTLPEILQEMENESFATTTKTLTLLGNKKTRSFSMDLFLPTKPYDFAKNTGTEVLNLLGYVSTNKIPMRVIITDGINELLNIAVSISNFKYYFDRGKNIRCSVSFVEYIFLTEKNKDNSGEIVKLSTVAAQINNTKANISGVNIDGSNLVRARDVLQILGINVGWNPVKKRVTANGKTLDIHTRLYNGSAYCFVRDLAEQTGVDIEWDSDNKTVVIKR